MKNRILSVVLAVSFLIGSIVVNAQTVTQERCQQADAQLNQVYKQLMGTLNDAQKQQLKTAQRQWIKQRDNFVAQNAGNPQEALYQATMQRLGVLQGIFTQISQVQQNPSNGDSKKLNQQYDIYQNRATKPQMPISNEMLARADEKLNEVYKKVLKRLNETEKQKLIEAQRGWIKQRDEVVSHEDNQRYEYERSTDNRRYELEQELAKPFERNKSSLKELENRYYNLLNDRDKQIYNATDGLKYRWGGEYNDNQKEYYFGQYSEKSADLVDRLIKEYNGKIKLTKESAEQESLQTAVAFQNKHTLAKNSKLIPINAVYLKESDVYVTALDQEIKIWEGKTGKLLRNIPVSSSVDWLFPSKITNSVVALSIDRKWSGGERRDIDVETGAITNIVEKYAPYYQGVCKIARLGFTNDKLWSVGANRNGQALFPKPNEEILSEDKVYIGDISVMGSQLKELLESSNLKYNQINLFFDAGNNQFLIKINDKYILADKTGGDLNTTFKVINSSDVPTIMNKSVEANSTAVDIDGEKILGGSKTEAAEEPIIIGNAISNDSGKQIRLCYDYKSKSVYLLGHNKHKCLVAETDSRWFPPIQVSISSDAKRILVSSINKLLGVDFDQMNSKIISTAELKNTIINPIISKDGKSIAYSSITNSVFFTPDGSYLASHLKNIYNLGSTFISSWDLPTKYIHTFGQSVIQGINSSEKGNDLLSISTTNTFVVDLKNPTNSQAISYSAQTYDLAAVRSGNREAGDPEYLFPTKFDELLSFKLNSNNNTALKTVIKKSEIKCEITNGIIFNSTEPSWNWIEDCDINDSGEILVSSFGKATFDVTTFNPFNNLIKTFDKDLVFPTMAKWINEKSFLVGSSEGLLVYTNGSLCSFWKNPVTYPHGPYPGIDRWAFDRNSKKLAFASPEGEVKLFNMNDDYTIQNYLNVFFTEEGEPIYLTPENLYASHAPKVSTIAFTKGVHSYPLEQFDLRLNRPDIVLERLGAPKEAIEAAKTLREKRLKKMNVTEEMLKPDFHLPEVALTSEISSTTSSDQIDLKIKATDDKYPLERLRFYVNNVPINVTEGESLRDQNTQSLERSIPIKLASGRNKIQVSVLNSAGAESLYANAEVTCTAQRPKPTLYVVSMGVSNYANPDNNLKYAAKDAEDIAKKLKDCAGSLYGEVKELVLKDQEVSRENLAKVREFLKPATIDDSVVLFMAGHGLLDDKYDYYFGTSDIDPAHPEVRGIPFEEMDEILASLPCLKKSMLVDTCHAGELDADEKKQLAASDASAQGVPVTTDAGNGAKVAMRAIGTRGMQVKSVEGAKGRNDWYERLQDMFVDLRRGSGSTILSSSEGAEYAYESSDQQNGLFTYALMEALDGKGHPADAKTPEVTMSEVAEYVKKRVGDLTNHKQTPNARRVNLEGDFALGTTK